MGVIRFYAFAAVWGLVDALVTILAVRQAHSTDITVGVALIELVAAAIAFAAGRRARANEGTPWRVGALTGLAYGVFAGWADFLIHMTRQELLARTHGTPLPSGSIGLAVQAANSPAAHVVTWLGVMVESLVLGLILGWIGGLSVRGSGTGQHT